eukprot:456662-Pyramimonas_sp.AAC.1
MFVLVGLTRASWPCRRHTHLVGLPEAEVEQRLERVLLDLLGRRLQHVPHQVLDGLGEVVLVLEGEDGGPAHTDGLQR